MFTALSYHYGFTPDVIMNMPFSMIAVYIYELQQGKSKIQEPTDVAKNRDVMKKFGIL